MCVFRAHRCFGIRRMQNQGWSKYCRWASDMDLHKVITVPISSSSAPELEVLLSRSGSSWAWHFSPSAGQLLSGLTFPYGTYTHLLHVPKNSPGTNSSMLLARLWTSRLLLHMRKVVHVGETGTGTASCFSCRSGNHSPGHQDRLSPYSLLPSGFLTSIKWSVCRKDSAGATNPPYVQGS